MVVLAIRRRQSWIWDLSQQREPLLEVEESEENALLIIYREVERLAGVCPVAVCPVVVCPVVVCPVAGAALNFK
jgi:hypothetical protein